MFQDNLGQLYDPAECWTSSLRSRAGLPMVQNDDGQTSQYNSSVSSPFTLRGKDLSQAVWKLLSGGFLKHPHQFGVNINTTYHFEVGMILDEVDGIFAWDHQQIEKVFKILYATYHGILSSSHSTIFSFPWSSFFPVFLLLWYFVQRWSRAKRTIVYLAENDLDDRNFLTTRHA